MRITGRQLDVLRRRLATQRLTSSPLGDPAEVVGLLTCVQSQERDHAFYSLGLRTRRASYASVRAAHDTGAFLRTHILRPTWHFVRPEDLRWILALTSARIESTMRARHAQLGLDGDTVLGAAIDALGDMLRGRNAMTRSEIGEEFLRQGGRIAAGEQLGHLLMIAELRGVICSGPIKGVHHSYVLVDEVIEPAPELDPDDALVRLVRRFFAGHGPASVRDFARWSSLTMTATKAALVEIGDDLEAVEIEGTSLWFDPATAARRSLRAASAFLLPAYDEAVLTYPHLNFPAADGHPSAEHPDPFWTWIVYDHVNVGLWKRTVGKDVVTVETRIATSLGEEGRTAVQGAAEHLARFLGHDLDYREG